MHLPCSRADTGWQTGLFIYQHQHMAAQACLLYACPIQVLPQSSSMSMPVCTSAMSQCYHVVAHEQLLCTSGVLVMLHGGHRHACSHPSLSRGCIWRHGRDHLHPCISQSCHMPPGYACVQTCHVPAPRHSGLHTPIHLPIMYQDYHILSGTFLFACMRCPRLAM